MVLGRKGRDKTRFSVRLTPALPVRTYGPWGDDEAAVPSHVDAARQHALAIAEWIVRTIAEDPVLA